jgi:hypothetical protein
MLLTAFNIIYTCAYANMYAIYIVLSTLREEALNFCLSDEAIADFCQLDVSRADECNFSG